jgi:hypothetical protein
MRRRKKVEGVGYLNVGVILILKDGTPEALCVDSLGALFITDLTVFRNVSNPDGDAVKVGDVILPDNSVMVTGVPHLREWLGEYDS